jgi:membrane-bound ClpP family serine protease
LHLLVPIALVLIGIALIVVEVYFIPGFNVVGVFGAVLILLAVGMTFAESGFFGGSVMFAGSVAGVGLTFYYLFQSGAWNRFILNADLRKNESTTARESEHRSRYLGKVGKAVSPLRPTGIAEIDGERIEVSTEGEFISSGSAIRVVAMDRRRFFVRLAAASDDVQL